MAGLAATFITGPIKAVLKSHPGHTAIRPMSFERGRFPKRRPDHHPIPDPEVIVIMSVTMGTGRYNISVNGLRLHSLDWAQSDKQPSAAARIYGACHVWEPLPIE